MNYANPTIPFTAELKFDLNNSRVPCIEAQSPTVLYRETWLTTQLGQESQSLGETVIKQGATGLHCSGTAILALPVAVMWFCGSWSRVQGGRGHGRPDTGHVWLMGYCSVVQSHSHPSSTLHCKTWWQQCHPGPEVEAWGLQQSQPATTTLVSRVIRNAISFYIRHDGEF